LVEYSFSHKIIIYVKDGGTNFLLLWVWLCHVHHCNLLHLSMGPILATWCSRHVNMPQMTIGLGLGWRKLIWLKLNWPYKKNHYIEKKIQKRITRIGINLQLEVGLKGQKLKMPIKTKFISKVVLFQEKLKFSITINIFYNQYTFKLQIQIPSYSIWTITKTIIEILSLTVQQCSWAKLWNFG
jgi:hypothetical protein